MTGRKIDIHIYESKLPDAREAYVVTGNGVMLKRENWIYDTLAPTKVISGLTKVKPYFHYRLPPLPVELVLQIYLFFQTVYAMHCTEAVVLLYVHRQNKTFTFLVPKQKVKVAGNKYDFPTPTETPEGMLLLGTAHSHGGMAAFHSGIDQDDEKHFDGLHLTFGQLTRRRRPFPVELDISASFMIGGHRLDLSPAAVLEGVTETPERKKKKPSDSVLDELYDEDKPSSAPAKSRVIRTTGQLKPPFILNLSAGVDLEELEPESGWLSRVKKEKEPPPTKRNFRYGSFSIVPSRYRYGQIVDELEKLDEPFSEPITANKRKAAR